MNKKRTLAMLLAGAMLLPANAFAASPEDFTDFPTDWSAAGLRSAVQNGLLNGSNGQINSSGLLIRAQMAAIVNRAFAARKTADLSVYSDANTSAWYYNDLELAVAMRTFQGANGKLNPEAPITREEAFVVLARAFALESGDTSVLNNYTDGASVSAWARSSVAALIENGYVNGANGKLNPKNSITRAEFAKVISEMASTYADADDSLSSTVDGSVIVRENDVSLSGKTINGDLIIADGVSRIDLTGVTITGRIVLRGGGSGVTFKDTKAGKGIIANTDIAVSGSVDSITVVADGAKITGSGKVGAVQANADNVTVSTSGTKVTAANGVSGVKAGNKSVAAGKTETVGAAASGGGSSSGGSSSSGCGSSSGGGSSSADSGSTIKAEIADAKVIAHTEAGSYLTLTFGKDFSLTGTTIIVDGADVTRYASKVTDDGKIVKLPLTAQPGSVTLKNGNKTQTTALGTAEANAVYTGEHYLPDYYVKHGPLAYWDYYLTNYDDAGKARVLPSKTTFSVGTAAIPNEHPSYSKATVLNADGSGSVVIMYNYNTAEEKAWFDNIAAYNAVDSEGAVQLVAYDQYKSTWNRNLRFTVEKNVNHGSGKVATITIPFNQTNFTNNGRYYVRVRSTDSAGKPSVALSSIHVQQNKKPTLRIQENPASKRNLHFAVDNLVYGITSPIEEVTLTGPVGANGAPDTIKLENITDYFLFSQNLFVLYNDTENGTTDHLKYKGKYTLTIKANGFQDFSCDFTVWNGEEPVTQSAVTFDAISRATGGSSSGGSSGDSSGGYAISTDFLFDSDLIANALVLGQLNVENSYAALVRDYWNTTSTLDAVCNVKDTMYYDGTAYTTAMNKALWVSYAELMNDNTNRTVNPPHATKAVLEDGLLGDIQNSSESARGEAVTPAVSDNQQGKDVKLTFTGEESAEYLSKITGLYLNGGWKPLDEKYYAMDGNTITLKQDLLHIGSNSVRIEASGYKTQDVAFAYEKTNEQNAALSDAVVDKAAQTVTFTVENSDGDFLKNLYSVTLTKDGNTSSVWTMGVGGSDSVYYSLSDDYTTITLHNVKDPGSYSVSVKANYYDNALTKEFAVEGEVVQNPVPNSNPTVELKDGVYKLHFGDVPFAWYHYTSITVNGQSYKLNNMYPIYSLNDAQYSWTTENAADYSNDCILCLSTSAFTEDNNTVTISADGYKDLTVTVNKASGGTTTKPTTPSTVTVPTTVTASSKYDNGYNPYYELKFDNAEAWLKTVTGVTYDNKAVSPLDSLYFGYGDGYYIDTENNTIAFHVSLGYSAKDMVISAENNKNLTLSITAGGFMQPPIVSIKETTSGDSGNSGATDQPSADKTAPQPTEVKKSFISGYMITFGSENADYVKAITGIKVNNTDYKPGSFNTDNQYSSTVKTGDLSLNETAFTETKNTITIHATGYTDLTLTITKDGKLAQ